MMRRQCAEKCVAFFKQHMKENEEIHNEPSQSFNKRKQLGNGSFECQSQLNTGLEM